MTWWRRRSLHVQLILVSMFIMLFSLGATTLWNAHQERERLLRDHERQAQSLARMIALASGYQLIAERYDELESLLLKFALFPSVEDLVVTDTEGEVLAHVASTPDGPRVRFDLLKLPPPETSDGDTPQLQLLDRQLIVWQPVETSTRVGWVRVVFDISNVEAVAREILRDNLKAAMLVTALVVLVILLILYFPGRTFRQAVEFARRLTDQPGARLELRGGSREMTELINALNESSHALQKSRERLEQLNRELEQHVETRTEALWQSREELLLLEQAVDQSSVGIAMLDPDYQLRESNPAFSKITGCKEEDLGGRNVLKHLWAPDNTPELERHLFSELQAGRRWEGEFMANSCGGALIWVRMTVTPVLDRFGKRHYQVTLEDITERKHYEQQLVRQANYDALTGLPNRLLGMDRLRQSIQHGKRVGTHTVLMFIDLDRFKEINDTLGHRIGDLLLVEAAGRLTGCVRGDDTVARLGGDEFLAILSGIRDPAMIEAVAEKILQHLAQPYRIEGRELRLAASIGIAVAPEDSEDPDALLRFADTAMYRAKEAGRNRFHYYTRAMNEEAMERLRIGQALHEAMAADELSLHYQPLMAATNGRVGGAEALLRWHSGQLGEISPARFIPIAEENGLIVPIGRWVLFRACKTAAQWPDDVFVSVNVAYQQFREPGFFDDVASALSESGLAPQRLHLEITERALMIDEELLRAQIDDLQGLGVRFSIDDFGTGYSSLGYLRRFPCHSLKIDRSFVAGLDDAQAEAGALIEAIVGMGHALGLGIVAEGVETEAQATILQRLGCDQLQGYLFARPMPEPDFLQFLATRSTTETA